MVPSKLTHWLCQWVKLANFLKIDVKLTLSWFQLLLVFFKYWHRIWQIHGSVVARKPRYSGNPDLISTFFSNWKVRKDFINNMKFHRFLLLFDKFLQNFVLDFFGLFKVCPGDDQSKFFIHIFRHIMKFLSIMNQISF